MFLLGPYFEQWWGKHVAHNIELVFTCVECVALITVIIRYSLARVGATHRCWIDNRFLAEMLRSAAVLTCAGMKPPRAVTSTASDDWTLHEYNETVDPFAVDHSQPDSPTGSGSNVTFAKSFLLKSWLLPQRAFHKARAYSLGERGSATSALAVATFLLSLGCAVGALITLLNHGDPTGFKFGAVFLPAVGAAIAGYASHREYDRLAHRSAEQVRQFERIREELASPDLSPEDAERIASELRDVVLNEVRSWRLLVRFTEIHLG